jgi:phosphoribosylanthranilate isomerase
VEDVEACFRAGVDAVGLNFYSKSPRYISEDQLTALALEWPATVTAVGLFVDPSPKQVLDLVEAHPWIGFLQFHGLTQPPSERPPRPWILASGAHPESGFGAVRLLLDQCISEDRGPVAVILDGHVPGMHGGTGQRAPWHAIKPNEWPVPVVLAGGLNPDNVAEAMRLVGPWGLDLASGVEMSPGLKDAGAIKRLVQAVR